MCAVANIARIRLRIPCTPPELIKTKVQRRKVRYEKKIYQGGNGGFHLDFAARLLSGLLLFRNVVYIIKVITEI